MDGVLLLPALVQGLIGGFVALLVLALAAAIGGRGGVTFAELLTALAVGVAVGCASFVTPKIVGWQIRRSIGRHSGRSRGTSFGRGAAEPPDSTRPTSLGGPRVNRFDRFSDQARRVLTLAQDEAQRFSHPYIGTEHLLLGLIREGSGLAADVLDSMGIELAKVRTAVEFVIGRGDRPVIGEIGLTPGGKRAIELAIDEARLLGHQQIGTEHLLLGLVRVGEGSIAAEVLESMGVTLERARRAVLAAVERRDAEAGG